ncbi:MAG: ribosomal RNA adenine dimethylase domain-containing protein [bacterium]|nr:ribosomal RNA adenine dimethylase domain-containing protein [bacterium]
MPSSQALAQEMINQASIKKAKVIVEFGSGTGVFTKKIISEIDCKTTFLAFEYNQQLAEALAREVPLLRLYNQSAADLPKVLDGLKIRKVDCIISGLPWATFTDEIQDELLNAAYTSLKRSGRFVTFAYLQGLLLPGGIKFAEKINKRFRTVSKSRIIWNNIPPAFVYKCVK